MRKKLAIGAMALAAAAVAGCSSGGSAHDTSAASSPSPAATTGPATGTAACNAINSTLNTIMGGAAKATPAAGELTKQQAMQAKLASNLGRSAQAFTDDQSQKGITTTLKQAEQVIAANARTYAASYSKPDSGTYGLKIINALNQVKQQCGAASWQTAI